MLDAVTRHAFREEDVAGKLIFRVAGFGFGDCLVSELFKRTVEAARLKGIGFKELDWISEASSRPRRRAPTRQRAPEVK